MWTLILIFASYLAGSIPTSIIAGKLIRGIDIREHGSKNPGATNAFRVLGKKIGIMIGLIDIFKGFFAVIFLTQIIPTDSFINEDIRKIIAGIFSVAGHNWTVFAGFKGGKGVGTSFGAFLGLAPVPSLVSAAVWCILTFGTGYVSLGSIFAAVTLPIAIFITSKITGSLSSPVLILAIVAAVLIIFRHKANISRLIRGEENRFGKRGTK